MALSTARGLFAKRSGHDPNAHVAKRSIRPRNCTIPTYCRQAQNHCITQVTGSNLCTEIFSCILLHAASFHNPKSAEGLHNQATIRQIFQECEYACGWLDNKGMTQTDYLCLVDPHRFHLEPIVCALTCTASHISTERKIVLCARMCSNCALHVRACF